MLVNSLASQQRISHNAFTSFSPRFSPREEHFLLHFQNVSQNGLFANSHGIALMSRRAEWSRGDMPWTAVGVGIAAAILLVTFHPMIFGGSPLG